MDKSYSANGFVETLTSLLNLMGRQVYIKTKNLGTYDSVYVNFINLPNGFGKGGGGAEAENNRMSFWVHGFDKLDPDRPAPNGKVKVEMSNSALPRQYRLKAKTSTPEKIAGYLSCFLNKVVLEVQPNFTHSKVEQNTLL